MSVERSIAERLVRNRMKKINESTDNNEYTKSVEKFLNYNLGAYETGAKVLDVKVISKTPNTVTLNVEYSVTIRIPIVDPEDHSEYYGEEVEYRRHTMVFDLKDLRLKSKE